MLVPIAQRNAENGKNYAMSLVLPRGWLILFYTKRKLSDVVEKSIPKNIDRDLKQKM